MNVEDIEREVRDFIARRFGHQVGELGPETSLLDGNAIDSLGLLEIVMFVTERFGVEVSDDDFLPENFETPARIATLVAGRAASQ